MQTTTYTFFFDENTPEDKDNAKDLAEMKHSWVQVENGYRFNTAKVQDTFDDEVYTRVYFDNECNVLASIRFYLPDDKCSAYIVVETIYQSGLNYDRKKKQRRK